MEAIREQRKRKREDDGHGSEEEEGWGPVAFTCEICTETKSANQRFNNKNKSRDRDRCVGVFDHNNHAFCSECVEKHIDAKVEDNMGTIECPHFDCHQMLDPISCRSIVTPQLFVKWCDLLCNLAIIGFEKCHCPYQDCGVLIVNECGSSDDDSRSKKWECPSCKKLICFRCKLPWHACDEQQDSISKEEYKDQNDVLFEELVKFKRWTKCPGCCLHVERISGCNSVSCRCGTYFCYICGKAYENRQRGMCLCG